MAHTRQVDCDLDNPEEAFAWMFVAGVPDMRGEHYPHQPAIPFACWPLLSKMIWDMGGRVHPELQTKWVNPPSGPMMSYQAWGTTDTKPDDSGESEEEQVALMLQAAVPEAAKKVAGVESEEDAERVGQELQKKIRDGMAQIQQLRGRLSAGEEVQ